MMLKLYSVNLKASANEWQQQLYTVDLRFKQTFGGFLKSRLYRLVASIGSLKI